jgi:hypothetical protein
MAAAAELLLSDSRGPARGLSQSVGWGWKTTRLQQGGWEREKKIGESTTACLINKTMVTNYSFHFFKKILLPE